MTVLFSLPGYWYELSDDAIRRYLQIPPEERLEWLEEANRFLWEAQPLENRALWEQLRRGEV